jgi:hypothetical protein
MDTQPVADSTVAAADVVAAAVAAAVVAAAKTIDETKTSGGDPAQDSTAETTDVCVDPKTVVPKELEATSVVEAITERNDASGVEDPEEAEKPATVIVDVDRVANDVIDVEEDPVVDEQKATTEDSVAPKEDPPANEPEEATNAVVVSKEDPQGTTNDVINPEDDLEVEEPEAAPLLGLGLLEPEASQAPVEDKENHGVDAVFSSPIGRLADDDADHTLLKFSATETEEDSIIRSMISSPPPIKKRSSPEPKIEDEPDMKKISAEGLVGPQENAY